MITEKDLRDAFRMFSEELGPLLCATLLYARHADLLDEETQTETALRCVRAANRFGTKTSGRKKE